MPVPFILPELTVGIVFLSSTLYGIFFILLCLSSFVLHRQCKRNETYKSSTFVYLGFNYAMFVILTVVWTMSAIMCNKPEIVEHAEKDHWTTFMFAQHVVSYLASFVGDMVMAYRLYIIWDQAKPLMYIYSILLLAAIGMSISTIFHFIRKGSPSPVSNNCLAGITIGVNLIICGLIVYKVWSKYRVITELGGLRYILRPLAIIAESSGIYTAWILTYTITTYTSPDASQALLYGNPHIAGIASMLINIRVGLGWAVGEEGRSTRALQSSISTPAFRRGSSQIEDLVE